jgi:hypothetical protein
MTLILMVSCLLTPLEIAFSKGSQDALSTQAIVDYSFDFLFFIDVLVIFNSAVLNEEFVIIDNRNEISKSYLKGWFSVDIISSVPFGLFN